jgi:hypothetical protein
LGLASHSRRDKIRVNPFAVTTRDRDSDHIEHHEGRPRKQARPEIVALNR